MKKRKNSAITNMVMTIIALKLKSGYFWKKLKQIDFRLLRKTVYFNLKLHCTFFGFLVLFVRKTLFFPSTKIKISKVFFFSSKKTFMLVTSLPFPYSFFIKVCFTLRFFNRKLEGVVFSTIPWNSYNFQYFFPATSVF